MGRAAPRRHAARAPTAHSRRPAEPRRILVSVDGRKRRRADAHGAVHGEMKMKRAFKAFTLLLLAAASSFAQAKGGPPAPALMACGAHGDIEIICGTRSPEDLELTPDGKFLIVPRFVNAGRGGGGPASAAPAAGMDLLDLSKKTFSKMAVISEPLKDWGDATCPGFIGDALVPHGISL